MQKYHSLELLVMIDGGYLVVANPRGPEATIYLFGGKLVDCLGYMGAHIAEPTPLREMSTTGAIP